jgi:hypothetical protein
MMMMMMMSRFSEFERIQKKALVAYLKYYSGICQKELRKNTKTSP